MATVPCRARYQNPSEIKPEVCKKRKERHKPQHYDKPVQARAHEVHAVVALYSEMVVAVGCGDPKAAKDFAAIERGASKFAFSRRKVFWDVVASSVRSGFTSDAAIDKVYSVYAMPRVRTVATVLGTIPVPPLERPASSHLKSYDKRMIGRWVARISSDIVGIPRPNWCLTPSLRREV
ncbi:uncharacterized protein PITG_08337 [Phytophthora infestans T30-4]|uniref:Uncharacterized protein n=1 Tax=Phytophthora infestans (strain T30-4) TaxID=403677 RepID=D0NAD0_PHYIT|nr:uncharacterized protein PITG_08337 [Phytophthora infestans T30-4]EEY54788.1 conserved hypothetical protein [Phytophthora infestans T30-4]|eukprot:XP_002903733.1 conserved hypothetical protein [Phytophthora infestans T30-4]